MRTSKPKLARRRKKQASDTDKEVKSNDKAPN